MNMLGLGWVGLVAALGLACSASDGAGSDGAVGGSGGAGAGGGTGGTSASGGSGGSLVVDGGGGSGGQPASCQFVDMLFVIDNSPSMGKYQEALAAAFPSFVDAMYAKLPENVNFHVGIVTTSFFTGNCGEAVSNCKTTATDQEVLAHYLKPTDGSTGTNGEQGRLFEHAGLRYFEANSSDADASPLKTWFTGAAVAAGETGCSFEMATAAAGYSAHAANATHNQGFFRDEDAVLLVFVLSDEPDKSPETLDTYVSMLNAKKTACGGDKCILTAGLVDSCVQGVNNTVWQFLNAFGEPPIVGDIDDETKYSAVVGDALAQVVKQTCDEIAVVK